MISFSIDGELEAFQHTAREFGAQVLRPQGRAAEARGAAAPEIARQYSALGLAGVEYPEAWGGLGQGMVARVVVEEALATGDLGLLLAMPTPGAAGAAAVALGTPAQAQEIVAPLLAEGGRGVLGWADGAVRPGTFATVARRQDDGWVLRGSKRHLPLGHQAQTLIVLARVEGEGPAAFVVSPKAPQKPPRAPWAGLAFHAAPLVDLALNDVWVAKEARLAGADTNFEAALGRLVAQQSLVVAARAVGLAAAAFDAAHGFAAERVAFDKPIAHFQSIAFLVADMAMRLEAMRALVRRAAWAFDHEDPRATERAAMALAEAHEGAMFVTNAAVQIHGGAGFVDDFPVEKWMREARAQMSHVMSYGHCDLLLGGRALGHAPSLEDAPLPELQAAVW